MGAASESGRVVRFRLVAEKAPPTELDGRPTRFGLRDKKREANPGVERPDGSVQFDLEVSWLDGGPSTPLRFRGPYVLGKTEEQHLGLLWVHTDDDTPVRGQKIRLDTLSWTLLDRAQRAGAVLQATVMPITERCATVPVEWHLIQVESA